ncbi:hypothetical protein GCM10028807_05620 [Spirosoma daeguense]
MWFSELAEKMRLKTPSLEAGEYEVRIWQKCQLCFGEAHELYRIEKQTDKFSVTKYSIHSNKTGFRNFTRIKPSKLVTDSLWTELVQLDILVLPDEAAIESRLRPRHKDSTYTSVEPDGSVSIHAKKQESSVWISDGESYHIDVFSQNSHRRYEYGNPRGYLRAKPKIQELQKIVAILDKLVAHFKPFNLYSEHYDKRIPR